MITMSRAVRQVLYPVMQNRGTPMLKAAVVKIVSACCRFAWMIVVLAAVITAGAAEYARQNFAITTDTGQLISPSLPWRQREIQFDAAFPQQSDTIVIVVDAATPELAESSTGALADALAKKAQQIQSIRRPTAAPSSTVMASCFFQARR